MDSQSHLKWQPNSTNTNLPNYNYEINEWTPVKVNDRRRVNRKKEKKQNEQNEQEEIFKTQDTIKQQSREIKSVSNDSKHPSKLIKLQHIALNRLDVKIESSELRKISKRTLPQIDQNNPKQMQQYLKKCAKDYHKYLMSEVMKKQEIEEQAQSITIDKNLSVFPFENEKIRSNDYKCIDELRNDIRVQQEEILKQISDESVYSIFLSSLEETIKLSATKSFHNFKCKIPGCNAIIKCSVNSQQNLCDLYLFRNRHNHTITGVKFKQEPSRKQTTIVLDEELHEMFGFNKGVWSQTRNIRYVDPEKRKKIEAQQKKEYKERQKLRKNHQVKGEHIYQGKCEKEIKDVTEQKAEKSGRVKLETDRTNREDGQFTNMAKQLIHKGFIVQAHPQSIHSQFPAFVFITKQQWLSLVTSATTIRIVTQKGLIKLNQNKQNQFKQWSLLMITALNQSLKPLILAFCLSSDCMLQHLPHALSSISIYCPSLKFIVSQYKPHLFQSMKTSIASINNRSIRLLLDSNDIIKAIRKHLRSQKNRIVLKKLVEPCHYYAERKYLKYLLKRNQQTAIKKYQQFKQFVIIPANNQFYGVRADLSVQKTILLKLKQRFRYSDSRFSLNQHLNNLISFYQTANRKHQDCVFSESVLEIERVHNDMALKEVRKSISRQILNEFYIQYGEAIALDACKLEDGSFQFEKGKITVQQDVCSCGYREITGIVCSHLIWTIKKKQLSYLKLLDQKWLINDNTCKEDTFNKEVQRQSKRSKHRQKSSSLIVKKEDEEMKIQCEQIDEQLYYNNEIKQMTND